MSDNTRFTGTLTQFNIDRGFGFVSVDGRPSERAFVHVTDVRANGVAVSTLALGTRLEFRLEYGEKSPKVCDGVVLSEPVGRSPYPSSSKEAIP
jgi:cold shock CspA family protein